MVQFLHLWNTSKTWRDTTRSQIRYQRVKKSTKNNLVYFQTKMVSTDTMTAMQ